MQNSHKSLTIKGLRRPGRRKSLTINDLRLLVAKFVGTIFAKTKIILDSTRHKFVHGKIVIAVVASCKQIGIIPNDNPIGLDISNEIVSVQLGRSGHASKLWLACLTADSHDLKMRERFNLIVHNNTVRPFFRKVKSFFHFVRKSLTIKDLRGSELRKSLITNDLHIFLSRRNPAKKRVI